MGGIKSINYFIERILNYLVILKRCCKMLYEMRKREKIVKCLGVRY